MASTPKPSPTPGANASTPQERLAISRRAMVKHMTRDKRAAQQTYAEASSLGRDEEYEGYAAPHNSAADGTWRVIKHAVHTWWQHHPVNIAIDIARPVLSQFAQEHPVKLVGIAAGIGVATVVLRPWRLVSLGTVVAATLKTPQLPNFLLSMLTPSTGSNNDFTDTDTRPR